jgi:flagellar motor protein MotB
MRQLVLYTAIIGLFGGACTQVPHVQERAAAQVEPKNYNYGIEGGNQTGLVLAFDDGKRTVLQFLNIDRTQPRIYAPGGGELTYRAVGQYAILETIEELLVIRSGAQESRVYAVKRRQPNQAMMQPANLVAQPKVIEPVKLKRLAKPHATDAGRNVFGAADTMSVLEKMGVVRMALRAEPERVSLRATNSLRGTTLEALEEWVAQEEAQVLRVAFAPQSARFRISAENQGELLRAAARAARIEIRGRTDSIRGIQIARARAEQAKRYLVRYGIKPDKIQVVKARGDMLVADNGTTQGRARNRGVDISFVGTAVAAGDRTTIVAALERGDRLMR